VIIRCYDFSGTVAQQPRVGKAHAAAFHRSPNPVLRIVRSRPTDVGPHNGSRDKEPKDGPDGTGRRTIRTEPKEDAVLRDRLTSLASTNVKKQCA